MTRERGKAELKTANYGYKDDAGHAALVTRAVANCRDIETASQLWRATTLFAATLPKQTCFNELLELGREAVLAKRRRIRPATELREDVGS